MKFYNRNKQTLNYTILLIVIVTINLSSVLNISFKKEDSTENSKVYTINFANDRSNNENSNSLIKRRKRDLDKNTLPSVGGEKFQPIKINYVLVDSKLEVKKQPSMVNEEQYNEFKTKVIDPVDKYLQKAIKVYHFQINTKGQKCFSNTKDSNGKTYGFNVVMDDYLKDYVSHICYIAYKIN